MLLHGAGWHDTYWYRSDVSVKSQSWRGRPAHRSIHPLKASIHPPSPSACPISSALVRPCPARKLNRCQGHAARQPALQHDKHARGPSLVALVQPRARCASLSDSFWASFWACTQQLLYMLQSMPSTACPSSDAVPVNIACLFRMFLFRRLTQLQNIQLRCASAGTLTTGSNTWQTVQAITSDVQHLKLRAGTLGTSTLRSACQAEAISTNLWCVPAAQGPMT